jgi:hypothetical protein
MKPVKISLLLAALVAFPLLGCSSAPDPNEPETLTAGRRPNPGENGGDQAAPALQLPGDTHAASTIASPFPTPIPWDPSAGVAQATGLPATQPSPTAKPGASNPKGDDHHFYEAEAETLKEPR